MTVQESIFTRLKKDTRGATEFVELVILVAVIAIFGLVAFKAIGSAISKKADKQAQDIGNLP